jgi:DNA-directed RNA polymerase subunit H (RpoH/RPB5)
MTDFNRIYFGARLTCLEMMKDRRYNVPNSLLELTEKEFEVTFDKKLMDIAGITDDQGRQVYVKIIEPTRQFNKKADKQSIFKEIAKYFNGIGLSQITDEKELEKAIKEGIVRLIIIYNSRQPGQLQSKYEEEYILDPFIEVYQVHYMNINPKKNRYQPKYRLITNSEEIGKIYRRYDAKPIMFGSICIDDPINRYYGGRPAEDGKIAHIYEITREGVNIFYRKVVSKRMNIK